MQVVESKEARPRGPPPDRVRKSFFSALSSRISERPSTSGTGLGFCAPAHALALAISTTACVSAARPQVGRLIHTMGRVSRPAPPPRVTFFHQPQQTTSLRG